MNQNEIDNLFKNIDENFDREFDKQFTAATVQAGRVAKRGLTVAAVLILCNIVVSLGAIAGLIYFIFWCCRHFGIIGQ